MADKLVLFWASGSAPCWRIMLALEEKGLSGYQSKRLSMEKKEHKSEEVTKWNPRGQFPTFIHENHAINESVAACEYLERVFSSHGSKLLPDASSHAQLGLVLQRTHEVQNLHLKGGDVFYYKLLTSAEEYDEAVFSKRMDAYFAELSIWEKYLTAVESDEPRYLAGQELTLADVVFFPTLAVGVRFGLRLDQKYPQLSKYYDLMVGRPSVQKTWPPNWREAPAKSLFPQ